MTTARLAAEGPQAVPAAAELVREPVDEQMSFDDLGAAGRRQRERRRRRGADGCAAPAVQPDHRVAARPPTWRTRPAGLHFNLHLPQEENEEPDEDGGGRPRDSEREVADGAGGEPGLGRRTVACTPAQVGLATAPGTARPLQRRPGTCPDAAKVGTVEANTAGARSPDQGLASTWPTQEDNPFNCLLAFYIVLEDPQTGIVVKLAGKVSPDPVTGQLTDHGHRNPAGPGRRLQLRLLRRRPSTAAHPDALRPRLHHHLAR